MPAVRPTLRLLAALCALALPPAAAGQERLAPPVFLGTVTQANGTFELKFVLAKPGGDGRFELERALIVEPGATQGTCVVRPAGDLRLPDAYLERPVFDPASSTSRLAAGDDLPGFFARSVVALLSRPGFGMTLAEIRPYSACTRSMWEALVSLPAEAGAPSR